MPHVSSDSGLACPVFQWELDALDIGRCARLIVSPQAHLRFFHVRMSKPLLSECHQISHMGRSRPVCSSRVYQEALLFQPEKV